MSKVSILNNAVHDADETLRLVEMLCPRVEFSIGPAWSETNGKDASLNKSNKCGHVLWDQYWHGPLAPIRLRLEAAASGLKPPLIVQPTEDFAISKQETHTHTRIHAHTHTHTRAPRPRRATRAATPRASAIRSSRVKNESTCNSRLSEVPPSPSMLEMENDNGNAAKHKQFFEGRNAVKSD